jgi:vacuolar-type H+-ATPase subunit H
MPSETKFSGQIKVASRIVDYLSSGLYSSPAACLKELINNAYDADASEVVVSVNPDAFRIIIEDNGIGMDKDEFEKHFQRISESHKRDTGEKTEAGRLKIGKIGIGFIAANELCERMEIFSTKAGSADLLHVEIDFNEMRKPPEERRANGEYVKADYQGEVLEEEISLKYTRIFLESVRGEAKEILTSAQSQIENGRTRSLYGLTPESVKEALSLSHLKSWKNFDMYTETMLKVSLNVPVQYHSGWIASEINGFSYANVFASETALLNFSVIYDGLSLRKPTVFHCPKEQSKIYSFNFEGDKVSAKGYVYAQNTAIKPQNLNGLLIRIRNSSVGEYDSTFLNFPSTESSLFQKWISMEIWADDRLEDAMNIDRKTLRETHPAFVELKNEIHRFLRQVLKRVRKEIYEAGRDERRTEKARESVENITKMANEFIKPISSEVASSVQRAFSNSDEDDDIKSLSRKFTLSELYLIVVNVAKDTLDQELFKTFITKLTRELKK